MVKTKTATRTATAIKVALVIFSAATVGAFLFTSLSDFFTKIGGGGTGSGGTGVCTMEMKTCPDGSLVGKVAPTCNFAPCPGGKTCPDGTNLIGDQCIEEHKCQRISDANYDIYTLGSTRIFEDIALGLYTDMPDECVGGKLIQPYCDTATGYATEKQDTCPSGYACFEGVCKKSTDIPAHKCQRMSDANYDIYTLGATRVWEDIPLGLYSDMPDVCVNGKLIQNSCNTTTGIATEMPPVTCPNGCSGGECLKTGGGTTTPTCTGETQDKQDIYTYGTISGVSANGTKYAYGDQCNTDNKSVNEVYCKSDGTWSYSWNSCPNGCSGGVCLKAGGGTTPTCTDTDGGKNYENLGTVSGVNADGSTFSLTDKCGTGNMLNEYSCSNNKSLLTAYNCPETCVGGICMKKDCYCDLEKKAYEVCKGTKYADSCGNTEACNGLKDCSCPAGQTMCNGTCTNTQGDDKNCGACNNVCGWLSKCYQGVCNGAACSDTDGSNYYTQGTITFKTPPLYILNSTSTDLCVSTTQLNEYTCNAQKVSTVSTYNCPYGCDQGKCNVIGGCPGQTLCSGKCVDVKTDNNNCGICGTVCGLLKKCSNGTCVLGLK